MDKKEYAARVQALCEKLYRSAYLLLGRESDALDAVDEAVFRGMTTCRKCRHPEYFDTWLTRILLRVCHTQVPRRAPRSGYALTGGVRQSLDALPLRDAVSRLPGELRDPLVLRYFSGYTTAEAAYILKISQGTAALRIRRALAILHLEPTGREVTAYEPER